MAVLAVLLAGVGAATPATVRAEPGGDGRQPDARQPAGAAATAACQGGVGSDFNGDGVRDTAIADPKATVGTLAMAGVVYIVDGATGTFVTLSQGSGAVPETPESNDHFGWSMSAFDANGDGCTDLAVGTPYEDTGTLTEDGWVVLLYGAPGGLGTGPASLVIQQGRALPGQGTVPETPESWDWFGYSVYGGQTAAGEPYLMIGAPGEDFAIHNNGGKVHYIRGTVNVAWESTAVGVNGAQTDDRAGYALAGSPYHIAVSHPGDRVGEGKEFAGGVAVYSHTLVNGLPAVVGYLTQDSAGVSDDAEYGDQFGKSVAMVPYRPVGAPAGVATSLLVVGVPGEDVGTAGETGAVQQFLVTPSGMPEVALLHQGSPGVAGDNEAGDHFGEKVLAVNTAPAAEASAGTVLVAAGAPGQDLAGQLDTGEVHVFGGGSATVTDTVVGRRAGALPGTAAAQELFGIWLGGGPEVLLVSCPYGGNRGVYAIAWSTLATGSAAPSATYRPGFGGLPSGTTAFGTTVA